jgi:hypothetical protein
MTPPDFGSARQDSSSDDEFINLSLAYLVNYIHYFDDLNNHDEPELSKPITDGPSESYISDSANHR